MRNMRVRHVADLQVRAEPSATCRRATYRDHLYISTSVCLSDCLAVCLYALICALTCVLILVLKYVLTYRVMTGAMALWYVWRLAHAPGLTRCRLRIACSRAHERISVGSVGVSVRITCAVCHNSEQCVYVWVYTCTNTHINTPTTHSHTHTHTHTRNSEQREAQYCQTTVALLLTVYTPCN